MGTSRRQGQVFRSRKCLIVSRSRAPTQNVRRRRGVNRSSSSPVHNCYSYHRPGRRKQQVQLLIQFLLAFLTILNVFFFEIQKENSNRSEGCLEEPAAVRTIVVSPTTRTHTRAQRRWAQLAYCTVGPAMTVTALAICAQKIHHEH